MAVERRWLYAGLLVAAGAAAGLARAIRGPKVRPDSRVLVVGDSLAVGLSPSLKALAKEQGVQIESLALSGTRIDQWAGSRKLEEKLAAFRPTLVLVSLGTNDEYLQPQTGGAVVGRQRPHLDALLSKIEASGAEVAWIGPPQLPKPQSNGVVAMLQDVIPRSHYFFSEQLEIPRGPDGLHPNVRGYAGWAGTIWHWLS